MGGEIRWHLQFHPFRRKASQFRWHWWYEPPLKSFLFVSQIGTIEIAFNLLDGVEGIFIIEIGLPSNHLLGCVYLICSVVRNVEGHDIVRDQA